MTPISTDTLLQIATMLVTASAIYGAIRADLRALHQRVDYLYQRIDKRCET